jgi:hypothetical protein
MNEEMTLDNLEELTELALRPHWAIGLAEGYMQRGAQLCTRDGRRMGNAVVAGFETRAEKTFAVAVTDVGTVMRLTQGELASASMNPSG